MNPHGIDPKVIDALNSASSLELFQLNAVIARMLADPRRIIVSALLTTPLRIGDR